MKRSCGNDANGIYIKTNVCNDQDHMVRPMTEFMEMKRDMTE